MKKFILSIFLAFCVSGLLNKAMSQDSLKYLALGDSYTIGEAVDPAMRWPVLLQKQLNELGFSFETPKIIATTGWTTDELIKAIKEEDMADATYDLVSLLIGVNNQYRGYPIEQYKKEFKQLLEQAIQFADGNPTHVFVVSIPDYGITQFAKDNDKDADKIEKELIEYDRIAASIAASYGVNFYNIRPISLKALYDHDTYIAKDGLHPSASMYQEWVDYFSPAVLHQLKK